MSSLHDYFASAGNRLLDERVARFKALDTPEKVRAFQTELRGIARDVFGAFTLGLAKSGAPPKVLKSKGLSAPGVIVESFVYEAFPNFWVSAVLYRPAKKMGRCPALVMPVGHWWEGKAAPMYQRLMRILARRGVICASFDGCGHGERVEWFSPAIRDSMTRLREAHPPGSAVPYPLADAACHGFALANNVTSLHCMIADPGYLCGVHQHALTAIAGKRLVDLLVARKDVDPARIGACGASGGGTDTRFLQALDGRLALAVPASILGSDRSLSGGDADQSLFFTVNRGISPIDLVICMAPKPMLVISASADKHDTAKVASFYRPFWDAFGKGENIASAVGEGEHGFPHQSRKIIAEFVLKHLRGSTETIPDDEHRDDAPIFKSRELFATFIGNVTMDGLGKGPRDLIRERTAALNASRPALSAADLRATVLKTICESESSIAVEPKSVQSSDASTTWDGDGAVPLHIQHYGARPALLFAHEDGCAGAERSPLMSAARLLEQPFAAVDLRGTGVSGNPGPDYNAAFLAPLMQNHQAGLARMALTQGRTLTGIRAADLLQAAQILQQANGAPADLLAEGAIGLTALIAAFLKPGAFRRVLLYRTPLSYSELATAPERMYGFAHFLFGVLEHFDTPDLTRALPKEKLVWINPANGSGKVVALAAAKRAHKGSEIVWRHARVEAELVRMLKRELQH